MQLCKVEYALWSEKADPDLAGPSFLSSHDFLGSASGFVSAQVASLTAKLQLPFVCLSQETIALYLEGVCMLVSVSTYPI